MGVVATAGAAAPDAAGYHGPAAIRTCPHDRHATCGWVRVPLYWSHPGGATTVVHFKVFRHTDTTQPALLPLVGMEGGPGLPSIESGSDYVDMLGRMHRRHDVIVMDNRGVGTSGVVDCKPLQAYEALTAPGPLVRDVDACRRQLGAAANAYGTAAVSHDLAYILRRLGVRRVDVYGDSYGDYSAQVFTLHYPQMVHAMVLDGSYNNRYDPFEREAVATIRREWTRLCRRSPGCGATSMVATIAAFDRSLERKPVKGSFRIAKGDTVRVDLTAPAFAELVFDAASTDTVFADLPAAIRAYRSGHPRALLRLGAEDVEFNESGPASGYSAGDLQAVSCHDYPAVWQARSDPKRRRKQLRQAIAALPDDAFAPFPKRVYLASYIENALVYGCLDWKVPSAEADPPFPAHAKYPHTPVLIFDGEFDNTTPPADARKVAHAWPNSTLVMVANSQHVTVEGDEDHCTALIMQRFLRLLHTGRTACAAHMPPITVVSRLPARLAGAPEAHQTGGQHDATAGRVAWVAAEAAADVLNQWFWLGYGGYDMASGLYGGSYRVSGGYAAPVAHLSGVRLVRNLSVTGTVRWKPGKQQVVGRLRVSGPGRRSGVLRLAWRTGIYNWNRHPATIRGTYAGRSVAATMRAPWVDRS